MPKYLVTKIASKVKKVVVENENESFALEEAITRNQWEDISTSTLSTNYIITKI